MTRSAIARGSRIGRTSVSGPGQNAVGQASRVRRRMTAIALGRRHRVATWTISGLKRGRPLAAKMPATARRIGRVGGEAVDGLGRHARRARPARKRVAPPRGFRARRRRVVHVENLRQVRGRHAIGSLKERAFGVVAARPSLVKRVRQEDDDGVPARPSPRSPSRSNSRRPRGDASEGAFGDLSARRSRRSSPRQDALPARNWLRSTPGDRVGVRLEDGKVSHGARLQGGLSALGQRPAGTASPRRRNGAARACRSSSAWPSRNCGTPAPRRSPSARC